MTDDFTHFVALMMTGVFCALISIFLLSSFEEEKVEKVIQEFHQAGVDVSVCGWKWDERKQEFWRKESTCQ